MQSKQRTATFAHNGQSNALAKRVESVKKMLQTATSSSSSGLRDSASLQRFKQLLADTLAVRQQRMIETSPPSSLVTLDLLDDTASEAGGSAAAASTPQPQHAGAPVLPHSCSKLLLEHLDRMGVSLHQSWSNLEVQSACWGVPLWVLQGAQNLGADGLPPQGDPLHWVMRLWPLLSQFQARAGAGGGAAAPASLPRLFFDALTAAGAPGGGGGGGIHLQNVWAGRQGGAAAVQQAVLDSYAGGSCVLPASDLQQLVLAVPEGLSCPDVPPLWLGHTQHGQRRDAWAGLAAHFMAAQGVTPSHLLSAQAAGAPPLGPQEAVVLAGLWHPDFPSDSVIAVCKKTPVKKNDLKRLNLTSWLNDELINCRLAMFAEAAAAPPARSYVPNLYFLGSLGTGEQYNYTAVRRWTKRAKVDVTALDRAVFPINTANMHWTAAVVDFQKEHCLHWDSLAGGVAGEHGKELRSLRQWLADELQDKHGMSRAECILQWPIAAAPRSSVPQQTNGIDCGVFCLQFCVALLCGVESLAAECSRSEHVPYLRLWYALAFFAQGPDKTATRTGKWAEYLRDTLPAHNTTVPPQAPIFSQQEQHTGGAPPSASGPLASQAAAQSIPEDCFIISD